MDALRSVQQLRPCAGLLSNIAFAAGGNPVPVRGKHIPTGVAAGILPMGYLAVF